MDRSSYRPWTPLGQRNNHSRSRLLAVQLPHGSPCFVNCDIGEGTGAGIGVGYGDVAKAAARYFVGSLIFWPFGIPKVEVAV